MNKKIAITSSEFEGEMILAYNQDGHVILYDNRCDLDKKQLHAFLKHFPLTLQMLEDLLGKSRSLSYTFVEADLSFAAFWDTYDYKVGNKKRAQKEWEKLSEAKRAKCLESITSYNYFLKTKPNQDRLYPETFLSQERYDIDYKKLVKS